MRKVSPRKRRSLQVGAYMPTTKVVKLGNRNTYRKKVFQRGDLRMWVNTFGFSPKVRGSILEVERRNTKGKWERVWFGTVENDRYCVTIQYSGPKSN